MSHEAFVSVLMLGAAVIALWVVQRTARRAPTSLWAVVAHLFAGYVLTTALLPLCVAAVPTVGAVVAVMGIAFPPLVYFFVGCAWLLLFLQRLLAPSR
jgi:hypothetical protein